MVITNYHASTEAKVFFKAKNTIIHQQSDKVKYAPQKCWGTAMASNGPDLVQAFKRKRWVKSDFKVPQPPPNPLPLRLKLIY